MKQIDNSFTLNSLPLLLFLVFDVQYKLKHFNGKFMLYCLFLWLNFPKKLRKGFEIIYLTSHHTFMKHIAELFSYRGTFEPPMLQSFIFAIQSTMLVPWLLSMHRQLMFCWMDYMLLSKVCYQHLIHKKDSLPW